ncbi:sigma-70 family RNA polymerase sigma factor [Sporosarcina trichiuri]|uniref:sigma-70 family RNA polymerase sigma factor n=1 Tax=Sporosarcina trichiuri TaxID=3056445 RepID=UPI0025B2F8E0|nr:sigma-70 family RNA polymerase sigma factor [Sporosarcina sp. 0.2-SM1T-5]WJY27430.1 sigma-70 family RNA polymerase sigma factor [Sporosarcina sp. 0.2-SM1T-5]WJY27450.1 sigma-70 family RNA polymerase sigma factor [Sporosarcina sp. 0.2-SM1T-5]
MQKLIDGEWHTPETLVEQYKRLVYKHAIRYAKRDLHFREDLVQVGYLGLLRAFERFDHEQGIKFITYATDYICGYMQRTFDLERVIHVPVQVVRNAWRIERDNLWALPDEDIAERLRITPVAVRNARLYFDHRQSTASLDKTVDDEGELDGHGRAGVLDDYSMLLMDSYTEGLNDREKLIVQRLMAGQIYEDIAAEYGITKSRVGQLVQGIRRKVKRNQEAME